MGKGGVGAVIGFAVGAALSFVGGGPVGTAVWIAKGIQGAAVGYSLLSGPSTKHKFGEFANTRSNVVPIPVIYGEHRVGGNIIYERVSNDKKELYLCVGIGEGEVESISDIEVNGEPISKIKGVTYNIYTGTQSQPADSRVLTGERFPNTAYIAFTFKANDQISSTPNITCVVKGRKVRVWKNGRWVTEFSNNPVWAILDLLTNKRYGLGKDDGVIDLESFKAEAAYCDEIVDGEKRFELDYVIDTAQSSLDTLSSIMATFRANLLYSDGQLRLKIEKSELPVQAFTMDNIVAGSFSYSLDSINEMPNQLIGQFSDRSNDWELGSVIYDDEIDQEARGVFSQTLTLAGVTRPSQAGRLIRYYHDLTKLCDTFCEFQAGIDAIHCEAGDVITVSHDVPGWEGKEFLILEMQEAEDDLITLRCRAYDSSIYHDKGSKYQPPEAPALPNPLEPPPSVLNLVLSEAHKQLPDGTWVPQIRATWDVPNTINWKSAHVWLSDDAGANWIYVKEVEGTSAHIDVVGTGEYRVRLVSENRRGVREDFGLARTSTITIVGKQAKPPNVTWADCSFVHNISLSWLPVDAKDIAGYEIRTVDDGWGSHNEQLIYKGTETKHSFTPTQRNYTFYVKAFDRHGNYSEQATSITLSLPAPPAPQQPRIEEYFTAIKVGIIPVNLPSVRGYNLYIKNVETDVEEMIPLPFATVETYSAPSGKTFEITVTAFDILGEGPRSEPLQATTTSINIEIDEALLEQSPLIQNIQDEIDIAKTSAGQALDELGNLEDRVNDAEQELGNIAEQVSIHDTKITNIEGELSSKVSQTDFNALAGTVSSHESTLSQHATAIQAKAEKSEVDALAHRVTAAEGQLEVIPGQIAAKASQADLTAQGIRITSAEQAISALDGAITSTVARIDEVEGNVSSQASQIQQLADEITLKVQKRTSDGKYVVTGIGVAIGEDSQSEVGILADIFRMYTSVNGEPQAIFVVDGPSGKMYLLGDLIADGTIKARQLDAEAVRTHLVQAEVAYIDDANVLHLRADKITVGGSKQSALSITKPEGGKLWHFDTSLHSTDGIKPLAGAVATLRPNEGRFGGAVSVEEGTKNLIQNGGAEGGYIWWEAYNNGWVIEEQIVKNGKRSFRCNSGYYGGLRSPLIPIDPTKPLCLSYDIYRVVGEGWWTMRWYSADNTDLGFLGNRQIPTGPRGVWERRSMVFYPEDYPVGTAKCRIFLLRRGEANSPDDIIYDNIQLEQKPFPTSFVDGTRAAGRLSYPANFNMDEGTIHVWFYFNGTTAQNTLIGTIFCAKQESGGSRNHFWLLTTTESGANRLWFQVVRDDGSIPINQGIKHFSDISDGWHSAVVRWSTSAQSLDVFLDGQLLRSYAYPIAGLLPFDVIEVGCRGTIFQSNTLFDELLILPYAATEEEIKAWYGMNAPFYDPNSVITYQGEGGYIEIDSKGQRFYRHGDPNPTIDLNTSTGTGSFRGHVIGAVYGE